MRLGRRRPGTSTAFVDASNNEDLLQVAVDEQGKPLLSFHLYDAAGVTVATTEGFERFPDGITVRCGDGEVILEAPADIEGFLSYRLYNHEGRLLTISDGSRTQIFAFLKMEGRPYPVRPPGV